MKHTNKRTFLSLFLCLAAGFGIFELGASKADAQVLVYRLDFKKSGRSINFDFFDAGYFVVDGLGGDGSFIATYREGGRDFYLEGSGTMFFAVKPGAERAVIRASADNGSAESKYLMIGDLDDKISVNIRGQRITLAVSSFLRGSVLASDPEDGVDFVRGNSIGFAGFADIKAHLDRIRTHRANRANLSVAQATSDLITSLENSGISDGTDDGTENGTGNGTSDGTGNGTGDGTDDGSDDGTDDGSGDGTDDV